MREALIVDSVRTPLGKAHRGSLRDVRPDEMMAHCIRRVLERNPGVDAAEVEDVIIGCGHPYGAQGHNIARVAALRAGLAAAVPALTLNRFCASGLDAIALAAQRIRDGAPVAIAGGVESISLLNRTHDPNPWVRENYPGIYMAMGETAEVVAKRYGISRQRQDEYALLSQQRTAEAQRRGWLAAEIEPLAGLAADECNRPATTLDALAGLPPVFDVDSGNGTVTAGNSSQLADGASATLLLSAERARSLPRQARSAIALRGYAVAGCEPDEMGVGPVFAVPKLLDRHGVRIGDVGLWELNEAFAVQVVYCQQRLDIDPARMNVGGGSISLGHPFGMTGSRLAGTLLGQMARLGERFGVVTMCVSGGQGAAALFENFR